MQRNLLLSLLIWLLEIILVVSFVSDRWTRDIQASEDQMLIAYFGVEKDAEIRQTSQKWFDSALCPNRHQGECLPLFHSDRARAAAIQRL